MNKIVLVGLKKAPSGLLQINAAVTFAQTHAQHTLAALITTSAALKMSAQFSTTPPVAKKLSKIQMGMERPTGFIIETLELDSSVLGSLYTQSSGSNLLALASAA